MATQLAGTTLEPVARSGRRITVAAGSDRGLCAERSPKDEGGAQVDAIEQSLSRRQRQVFAGLRSGMRCTEIAAHLRISVNTVRVHAQAVYQAFDVHSQVDLMRAAPRAAALDTDSSGAG
jgi:DNA-binding NarL/FixJ family response regulator